MFVKYGIKIVLVFDGEPLPSKGYTEEMRAKFTNI